MDEDQRKTVEAFAASVTRDVLYPSQPDLFYARRLKKECGKNINYGFKQGGIQG